MRYKKLFAILALAVSLTACGNSGTVGNEYEALFSDISADDIVEDTTSEIEGYFLPCTNGSYLMISENHSDFTMTAYNGDNSIFADLSAGDRVKVTTDGILETYPGQTNVYSAEKLSDGDISDIPADKLAYLEEMGYKAYVVQEDDGYELIKIEPKSTPSIGINFALPSGWEYEEVQDDDEPTYYVIVNVNPKGSEAAITIEYCGYNIGFCGTGLEEKEIDFNGYTASQGFYDGNDIWSFIILCDSDYYGCWILNNEELYSEYKDDIDFILSTVEFVKFE